MKVKDLMNALFRCPLDAEVLIDTEGAEFSVHLVEATDVSLHDRDYFGDNSTAIVVHLDDSCKKFNRQAHNAAQDCPPPHGGMDRF